MMYEIHEGNMDRLENKLRSIQNKCAKYGCEFHFEILGSIFKKVCLSDGQKVLTKFFQVEASGIAKVNNWEFIAVIEHNKPFNIIRSFRTDVAVPDRYYTTEAICEHCNTRRYRKDTYLIRNTETGEFKQVGKSCLKDFTDGLDAEAVTRYISYFDEIIKGQSVGFHCTPYYKVEEVLQLAVEAVNIYGYNKTGCADKSTKSVVCDFLFRFSKEVKRHENKGFNADREGNAEKVQSILEFVADMKNELGYVSSLKTLCGKDYCEGRDLGILVSAVACYNREVEKQERMARQKKEEGNSNWVGSVKDRLEIRNASVKLLASWDSMYGMTYMYKITDTAGNIFTWKTGKWLVEEDVFPTNLVLSLKGTVKDHSEFNGVKQTELTRCTILK